MSVIVDLTVPADEFALPETAERIEDGTFRALRLVAHESDQAMPFLWVDHVDVDRLCRTMRDDPSVEELTVLATFDGQCLLQVSWGHRVREFVAGLQRTGAMILGASSDGAVWHLRIYVPEEDHVLVVHDHCDSLRMDVDFEVETDLTGTTGSGYFGLTECQYETLVTAYELGYYEVPRAISQAELAELFGVTHQALSERLRRAHGTLAANGLHQVARRRDRSAAPLAHDRVEI